MNDINARNEQNELYAKAMWNMAESYHLDYIDWLDETQQKRACELEKQVQGSEYCICGQHEEFEK